jgi:hypothetical protein
VWGNRISAYTVLLEKPIGKTPLAQLGLRWKYDFKMSEEIEWGVQCIDLAQNGAYSALIWLRIERKRDG